MTVFHSKPGRAVHSNRNRRRRGAALIEFALVSVIFLAMLLGMLQFGIYLSVTNALWNLSREGARYAAVQPAGSTNADQNIKNRIQNATPPNINFNDMQIEIFPTDAALRKGGTPVEVRLTYDMSRKFFIPMPELANSYVTKTQMMVEMN